MLVDSERQAWSACSVCRTYSSRTSSSSGASRSPSRLRLGSAVPGILLLERQCRELYPRLRGQVGRPVDAVTEPIGGGPNSQLGVDAGQPGHVDRGEQEVAQLVHHVHIRLVLGGPPGGLVQRLAQLPQLV